MKTRLYRVVQSGVDNPALVRATNAAQAVRHFTRYAFKASVATDQDIYEFGKRGGEIEDATSEQETMRV